MTSEPYWRAPENTGWVSKLTALHGPTTCTRALAPTLDLKPRTAPERPTPRPDQKPFRQR